MFAGHAPCEGNRVKAHCDGGLVVAPQARALDRAAAHFRRNGLDRALAAGAGSEASPALALRSRRLVALPYRRSIAEAYRRIVREAQQPVHPSRLRVIPRRGRVTEASGQLIRLADALAQPAPVAASGVAQALLLLADGTGPLYNSRSTASLQEWAARATDSLELPGSSRSG
jgi:hypothetical protein